MSPLISRYMTHALFGLGSELGWIVVDGFSSWQHTVNESISNTPRMPESTAARDKDNTERIAEGQQQVEREKGSLMDVHETER